jgi:hypothetical protein
MDVTSDEQRGDPIADREALVGLIVEQLRRQGHYLAQLSSSERQGLADLQWAAIAAGRRMGLRTTTHANTASIRRSGTITVVVSSRLDHACGAAEQGGRPPAVTGTEFLPAS